MTSAIITAYCAGFFDGEGTVCIIKSKEKTRRFHSYNVFIRVAQKRIAPLKLLQSEFGGKLYLIKKRGISLIHVWDLLGNSIKLNFLEAVYPYLIVKKDEVEIAIQYLRRIPETLPNSCHITDAEREWRDGMFKKQSAARKMNHRIADARGQFEFPTTIKLFSES